MARNKLRESRLKSLPIGIHGDGDGLYLRVHKSGSRNWVFITKRLGGRVEMGLGGFEGTAPVGLQLARRKAEDIRQLIAEGRDPRVERRKKVVTFADCMNELLATKEKDWTNQKHRDQWHMTLHKYAEPLHEKPIADIVVGDVKNTLMPHWTERPETADRLRSRIQAVIDYGIAHGWRTSGNPAIWKGLLDKLMPAKSKLARGHHTALDYKKMPAMILNLRQSNSTGARFVEFLSLTAVRFGELANSTWDEFHEDVWVIEAPRMKAKKEHRVPLCTRAIEILDKQKMLATSNLVFEGGKEGSPISSTATTKALRAAAGEKVTLHGLRSSFRDWAGDCTEYPREVAEAALAHAVGNQVEAAYRRSDAFEKRRNLMNDWAVFLNG